MSEYMIKFPMLVQRALTDDLSRFGRPADDSQIEWDAVYDLEARLGSINLVTQECTLWPHVLVSVLRWTH